MSNELLVKYHHGNIPFSYGGASAAQVRQVLEQIQAELAAKYGNYSWRLTGDTYDGYKIIAYYKGGHFTEAVGKSPSKTLKNFHAAKQILADKYNIH